MVKRRRRRSSGLPSRRKGSARFRGGLRNSRIEALEPRRVLSTTLAPIADVTVYAGAGAHVALDGFDDEGDPLAYTVQTSGADLTARVLEGNRSLRMSVEGFGDMVFELFEGRAPRTTSRIIGLATGELNDGVPFYDGLTFHRVIQDFMIQGGDPLGDGTGGFGAPIDDEFHVELQHVNTGDLSMAKSYDDTPDSQFFITAGPQRHLDFNHSVFGFQTEGDDVRQAIAAVPTDSSDKPLTDVVISSMTVFEDDENGVLFLSADEAATGEADVTVTVSDGHGGTAEQTFHVSIVPDPDNANPFLGPIDPVETTVDTPVSFTLPGVDVEGDAIYYAGAVSPPNDDLDVVVSESTGLTTVTPSNGLVGVHGLYFGVRKSEGWDTQSWDTQAVPIFVHPAAPTSVELLPISDTLENDSDRITDLNNTAAETLWFEVHGVLPTAEVTLYAGDVPIGQAIADDVSVTIETDGQHPLLGGGYAITAVQTLRDVAADVGNFHDTVDLPSEASPALNVFIVPEAPAAIELASGSDTGADDGDRITSRNNTEGNPLEFVVSGVAPGATVSVYAEGWLIGQAVVPQGQETVTVQTDPAQGLLSDELHFITAEQSMEAAPGGAPPVEVFSDPSFPPLEVTVDTTAPDFQVDAAPEALEGVLYEFDVQTSEEAGQGVSYTLTDLPPAVQQDISIGLHSGLITWTPGHALEGSLPLHVVVEDLAGNVADRIFTVPVNLAPELQVFDELDDLVYDAALYEEELLTLFARVTGEEGESYWLSLDPETPPGVELDLQTGVITWRPTEHDGPGHAEITVRVTDEAGATGTRTIPVEIAERNEPPALEPIEDQTVDEGQLLELYPVATDPDWPENTLGFESDGLPVGAQIDPASGRITWVPNESQGGNRFTLTVRVRDQDGESAQRSFTVTVVEVNDPPRFVAVESQLVVPGERWQFDVDAWDPDLPANELRYSLEPGAPDGVFVDEITGEIIWDVPVDQPWGVVPLTVRATEVVPEGQEAQSGTLTLRLTVSNFRTDVLDAAMAMVEEASDEEGSDDDGSGEGVEDGEAGDEVVDLEMLAAAALSAASGGPRAPFGPALPAGMVDESAASDLTGNYGLFGTEMEPGAGSGGARPEEQTDERDERPDRPQVDQPRESDELRDSRQWTEDQPVRDEPTEQEPAGQEDEPAGDEASGPIGAELNDAALESLVEDARPAEPAASRQVAAEAPAPTSEAEKIASS